MSKELFNELQINKLINQVINDDDSFTISQDDFDILLKKATELQEGIVYDDMGCGILASSLPIEGMTDLIANISGATDSYYVANEVDATIEESTNMREIKLKENDKDPQIMKKLFCALEKINRLRIKGPRGKIMKFSLG